eukprot:808406-Rhodomonas_salina.1
MAAHRDRVKPELQSHALLQLRLRLLRHLHLDVRRCLGRELHRLRKMMEEEMMKEERMEEERMEEERMEEERRRGRMSERGEGG